MRRPNGFALPAVILACVLVAGCSDSEEAKVSEAEGTAADERVPKVPVLEDYTYYVGGPRMKSDPYGRYRIREFLGEVAQPPSRGMVFGVKRDGEKIEYRVWGNGRLLSLHRGVMRDGLYWQEYVEGYRNEKLVAREYHTNDDAERKTFVKVEDVDPETGEVIRVKHQIRAYEMPQVPDDFFDDEDDEDDEDEDAAEEADEPAPAAPQPGR